MSLLVKPLLAHKKHIETKMFLINKINRNLYIIWLLEEMTNNSNKYCIFGLTFQSPWTLESKSEYTVFIGIICHLFQ